MSIDFVLVPVWERSDDNGHELYTSKSRGFFAINHRISLFSCDEYCDESISIFYPTPKLLRVVLLKIWFTCGRFWKLLVVSRIRILSGFPVGDFDERMPGENSIITNVTRANGRARVNMHPLQGIIVSKSFETLTLGVNSSKSRRFHVLLLEMYSNRGETNSKSARSRFVEADLSDSQLWLGRLFSKHFVKCITTKNWSTQTENNTTITSIGESPFLSWTLSDNQLRRFRQNHATNENPSRFIRCKCFGILKSGPMKCHTAMCRNVAC